MHELWHALGITPVQAVGVILSTTTVYLVFGGVLRLWGQRLWASPRSLDLAVVTVLGAIAGRATMGHVPTLLGALIALATLVILESIVGGLRKLPLPSLRSSRPAPRATAIVVAGKVRTDELARYNLTTTTLWSSLRQAGISHLDQVALVVVEPNGKLSIVRAGQVIHPSALTGIRGSHTFIGELRERGWLRTRAEDPPRT